MKKFFYFDNHTTAIWEWEDDKIPVENLTPEYLERLKHIYDILNINNLAPNHWIEQVLINSDSEIQSIIMPIRS